MPSYEYECRSCGWAGTKRNISIVDRQTQDCPNGHRLQQIELPSSQAFTKYPLGFASGVRTTDGRIVRQDKKKPRMIKA